MHVLIKEGTGLGDECFSSEGGAIEMEVFEKLYDDYEHVKVRFIGFSSYETRYDFGIVFTNLFFGKPLVICMQTGRSVLMELRDLEDTDYLQSAFKLRERREAMDLADFLKEELPGTSFQNEYE